MAINVNTVYRFCQFVTNKEQSGFFKPKDFNLISPIAQLNIYNELIAKDKELQAKRSGVLPSMGSNFKIDQELSEILSDPTNVATVNQIAAYPNDCLYVIRATHDYISPSEQRVVSLKIVDTTREMDLVNSYVTPPTPKYPLGVYYNQGLKVYPSTLNSINFIYLKNPTPPLWAFTEVNGLPVYDANSSVDFALNPNLFHKLVTKILTSLGINLSEERVLSYANQVRQTEEI